MRDYIQAAVALFLGKDRLEPLGWSPGWSEHDTDYRIPSS
jgi:hypothetical protein